MKRTSWYFGALLFFITPFAFSETELLNNADFENPTYGVGCKYNPVSGALSTGWFDSSCADGATSHVSYTVSSVLPVLGKSLQTMQIISGAGKMISSSVKLTAAKVVYASIYMKALKPTRVQLILRNNIGSLQSFKSAIFEVDTTWRKYEISAYIPATQFVLMVSVPQIGTVSFDNAHISAQTEILTSPSFEGASSTKPSCSVLNNLISGTITSQWNDNSCYAGGLAQTILYGLDKYAPHSGQYSQKIYSTRGFQVVGASVTPAIGEQYTFSIWARGDQAQFLKISLRKKAWPYTDFVSHTQKLTAGWQQIQISGALTDAPVAVVISTSSAGTVWLDDASLSRDPLAALTYAKPNFTKSSLGLHIHNENLAWPTSMANQSGFFRIWDTAAQWSAISTCPSVSNATTCANPVYNFTALEKIVKRAEKNGSKIIMNLGRTPQWASARPNEDSHYKDGDQAEPANLLAWDQWITDIATKYKGRIKYWEIWNEPYFKGGGGFYSGDPEILAEMQKRAYAILKKIDATNTVITPAFAQFDYLSHYLHLPGIAAVTDVVAYHFYTREAPEVLATAMVPNVKKLMESVGIHKPLWNTETGVETVITEAWQKNSIITRLYLNSFLGGAEAFMLYAWDNQKMGVTFTESNGVTPTSAGVAIANISTWLVNRQLSFYTKDTDGSLYFRVNDAATGKVYFIVYNPSKNVTTTLASGMNFKTITNLSGVTSNIVNKVVAISPLPVLLSP